APTAARDRLSRPLGQGLAAADDQLDRLLPRHGRAQRSHAARAELGPMGHLQDLGSDPADLGLRDAQYPDAAQARPPARKARRRAAPAGGMIPAPSPLV